MKYRDITRLEELPPYTMCGIKRFFEDYKKLEGKHVTVNEYGGKEEACKIILDSIRDYETKFPDNPACQKKTEKREWEFWII